MSRRRPLALGLAALVGFALIGGPTAPRSAAPLADRAGGSASHSLEGIALAAALPMMTPDPERTQSPDRGPAASEPTTSTTSPPPRRAPVGVPTGPVIALTFDDGPDARWTPPLLALLAGYHAHATFCMIGRQVKTRAAVVRAVVAGGHELCNHSFSHDEQLGVRPGAVVLAELRRTTQLLQRAAPGAAVPFFRAPGGNWTAKLRAAASMTALRPLGWTVDPRDWDEPGTAAIVQAVLAGVRPGVVVLLHDGGGDRSQTLAALRILLPMLIRRGYMFVTTTSAMAGRTH